MSAPAPSIGARLKAERERRGLSAHKAADEMHLDVWVIEALEADDFARIGPAVYGKGHLKKYAALLGLPAAEILSGYELRAQAPPPPPAANVRLRAESPAVGNLPVTQILGIAAAALLLGGVLWWKPWHQRSSARVSNVTAPAASPRVETGSPAADSASAALEPPAVVDDPMAAPNLGQPDATAGVGHARLRLSFSADSAVVVHDAAGRRVFAGTGLANSVKNINGMAPMRVYLGVASGVQLEINGRTVAIGPQFVAGDVARFEVGADGVLRRDSHHVQTRGASGTGPPG